MKIPELDGSRRARAIVIAGVIAGAALIIGGAFVLLALFGNPSRDTKASQADTETPVSATATATAGPPQPTATTAAVSAGLVTPAPAGGGLTTLSAADLDGRGVGEPGRGPFRGVRMVIPSIGVDAPFTVRTVGSDGKMPNPKGPEDVVWYDFSQWPGLGGNPGAGGNAVFSGHVDYVNYGPAVFWDLRKLAPGDEVKVVLDDGSELRYVVQWNKTTRSEGANWDGIVRATQQQSVTLITCTGTFDQATRQYDQRIIVWATRA